MPKVRPLAQQRKRRVHLAKASPFPIPIATITGESANNGHWLYYKGTLGAYSVVVHHSGDMDFLYRMGFFGKGEMSRGQPQWQERCRMVTLSADRLHRNSQGRALRCRVMSRRQYMMHLKWQLLCQGKLEAVNEICDEENNVICERAESFKGPESTESEGHFEKESCHIHPDDHDHQMSDEETKETTEALGEFSDLRSTSNFQATSTADSGTADWDDADPGCADFWGSSPVESQSKFSADMGACGERDSGDKDFWGAGVPVSKPTSSMEPSFRDKETSLSLEKIISPRNFEVEHCSKDKNTEIMSDVGANKNLDVNLNKGQNVEAEVENKNKSELPQESHVACSRFNDESVGLADSEPVFVIPDSDEDEQDSEGRVYHTQTRWKPVLKQDPFPQQETLHLSYEEAFFLSFGLGCLRIVDSQQNALNLTSMWKEFCKRQPSFLPNYIAYHYFRSKNWVPKPGLKFGCNFLLYKDGPPFYHGSYSVVVKFVDTHGEEIHGYQPQRSFSWTSLAGLKRITEHVGKELMFCYVIKPRDMTAEDMMSPRCISYFQVKEVLVSRWVSSQERERKGLEEIP